MRKVEIFIGNDMEELQAEINDWFANHPQIIVEDRLQSESPGTTDGSEEWRLTISVFYNEVRDSGDR